MTKIGNYWFCSNIQIRIYKLVQGCITFLNIYTSVFTAKPFFTYNGFVARAANHSTKYV